MDFLGFALKMRNKNNFVLNIYFLVQNRQQTTQIFGCECKSSIKYAYEIKFIYSEKATKT